MTYTISRNDAFNSVEVVFTGKPSEAVRSALKGLRFRWHGVRKLWYGYKPEDEVRAAIENAEQNAEPEAPAKYELTETAAYMGGTGFVGSNAGKHLYGAELSQAIRDAIKADGIKGVSVSKESYSGGQSINIKVAITDADLLPVDSADSYRTSYSHNISHYHIDSYECFTPEFKAKLHRIVLIAQSFNYDNSNGMVDYYENNFFLNLRVKYSRK